MYGILKGVVDSNAFVKGSWGAAICDEMAPQEQDIVVEGKRGLDRSRPDLDFILRSWGVETVALAGFLTTAASSRPCAGVREGYDVVTLTDCTAATSDEEHASRSPRLPDVLAADDVGRVRGNARRRRHGRGLESQLGSAHCTEPAPCATIDRCSTTGDPG